MDIFFLFLARVPSLSLITWGNPYLGRKNHLGEPKEEFKKKGFIGNL